jgi:hypothetical protein
MLEIKKHGIIYLFVKVRIKQFHLVQVPTGHVVAPLMIDDYGAFVECI